MELRRCNGKWKLLVQREIVLVFGSVRFAQNKPFSYGLSYHAGHKFTSDGAISCKRVGTCSFVCNCTKFPCCLVSSLHG